MKIWLIGIVSILGCLVACVNQNNTVIDEPDLISGNTNLPPNELLAFDYDSFLENDKLPMAYVGQSYSLTFTGTGGSSPYTFELLEGAFPEGLSLTSDGVLSGTPTSKSAAEFDIILTDNDNFQVIDTFYLAVNYSNPVEITTTSLPFGKQGEEYTAQLEASGGSGSYEFEIYVGQLPYGLELNSSTGAITSLAPINQVYNSEFTLKVKDTSEPGNYATKRLAIQITEPIRLLGIYFKSYVNVSFERQLLAYGGSKQYLFEIDPFSIVPAGFNLTEDGLMTYNSSIEEFIMFTVLLEDELITDYESMDMVNVDVLYRDARPDMVPGPPLTFVGGPPSQAGQRFEVEISIQNDSNGGMGGDYADDPYLDLIFYYSEDNTYSEDDGILSFDPMSLNPGYAMPYPGEKNIFSTKLKVHDSGSGTFFTPGSSLIKPEPTLEGQFIVIIPPDLEGDYYFGYVIDPFNKVPDSNPNNNAFITASPITISSLQETEPNDTLASAEDVGTINAGESLYRIGAISYGIQPAHQNSDFFKVTTTGGEIYSFYLRNLASDVDLQLWENVGDSEYVLFSWNGGESDEQIISYTATDTDLYIEVVHWEGMDGFTPNYELEIQRES
jgi:hypothetical protein